MHNNRYTDIVDHWKIELLRTRARRLGFDPHDIQEAEQEIVPLLAEFQFDPTNGATERTALTCVIDNRLKNVKRRSARYARHIAESRSMKCDDAVDTTARSLLVIDVRDAVAGLPDREQAVCRGLLDGDSVHEIAKQLGCTWHTIRRLLDGIRERFTAMGLDGWLGA
jgi:DNA-directed RNA polymerase specialized sigma24 family protein